jgi:Hemolysin activation/secretion protein
MGEKVLRTTSFNYSLLWAPRGMVVCFCILSVVPVFAQSGGLGVPERPGDERQRFPEQPYQPPTPPALTLPPLPPSEDQRLSRQLRVFVRRIKLTGNTVFSEQTLAPLIKPYEGRELTSEDLQVLRSQLTRYYIDHGYINSGAVIPDQQVKDGVIELRIFEGRLTDIGVSGNDWLRESYISKRLALEAEAPLNLSELQERIQILQQNRLIERINAELGPGAQVGESMLKVQIKERRPYAAGASFNNYRSPSVGELRGEVWAAHYNLSGFGDSLSARYGLTGGLDEVAAAYTVPLNAYDTGLGLSYERSDSEVIEEPFDALGITSKAQTYGILLSHLFYRTPQKHLTGTLTFERRHSETTLLSEPFSFSPGVRNGKSDVTVLRFGQEWVDRGPDQVIAARSIFSVGIDALGATINPSPLPDGRFFTWLGQFQWIRRLWDTDNQVLFRSDLQLAAQPLLPLEKFAVGGAYSVRGYRENQLVRDNGWFTSLEFRIPVVRLPLPWLSVLPTDGIVQIAPFYDLGLSYNTDSPTPDPKVIHSLGLGLRWDPNRNIHGEFYWGYPLRKVDNPGGHSLQDEGIFFALNVQLL